MSILAGKYVSTLEAAKCLAKHTEGPVNVLELSIETGLSVSYLEQIFAPLREKKLVSGVRGPGGGYQLTRPASHITLADLVITSNPEEAFAVELLKGVTLEEACSSR